jgi:hypothetical protein
MKWHTFLQMQNENESVNVLSLAYFPNIMSNLAKIDC